MPLSSVKELTSLIEVPSVLDLQSGFFHLFVLFFKTHISTILSGATRIPTILSTITI